MTLKRNLIANYLGQGWVALMGLAFIPLYIKYLGIEAYGLIGLFAVLTSWLSLLDMGMTPTLGREMARFTGGSNTVESIRDLLRSIEFVALSIAASIATAIVLGSNWLADSWLRAEELPTTTVAEAIAIMGLIVAVRFVEGIYRSAIVGLQRQVLFNAVNSSMATLRWLGAVCILAWVSPTINAFFLWQCFVAISTLIILAYLTNGSLPLGSRRGKFSMSALLRVRSYAGGMLGITFLALLLTQVDKLLLSKLLGLTDFGYYSLASVVAGALFMLVGPITQAWFPRLSQLHSANDHTTLINSYHMGAQLVTVIVGSASIVLIPFAETLLSLWTQDDDLAQRVAPLLRVLIIGNLLNALMWIPYQTQLAYGWTGLAVRVNIIAVLVIIPAILWVTPRYGAIGAAWVWVGLNAGYVLVGIHFMYRRILITEKWRWYTQDILIPLLAAGTVIGLLSWHVGEPDTTVGQITILGMASVFAVLSAGLAAKEVRDRGIVMLTSMLSNKYRTFTGHQYDNPKN